MSRFKGGGMRIVILSDVHFTAKKWRNDYLKQTNEWFYNDVFRRFFKQDADLYVSLGDLTHYGTINEHRAVRKIIEDNKRKDQRFLPIAGNHDLLCITKRMYQTLTGMPLYWAEDYPDVKLIFLDTPRQLHPGRNSSRVDWDQIQFLKRELHSCGDKLAVVFAHHPPDRISLYGPDRKKIPGLTMESLLEEKEGAGIFVNGHLHKDRYAAHGKWGYFQFNDILDEPTFRVLEIEEQKVSMETVAMDDPATLHASRKIAKSVLTFLSSANDVAYARVRDIELDKNILDPINLWRMQFVRLTNKPYFSKKRRM